MLYITLRGTILVYLDVPLSSPSIYNVIQFKCCNFCSTHFSFVNLYLILCYITLYLQNYVSARYWRNKKKSELIAFLAGENENRQPGRFVTGQFFRLCEIFLLSVKTNSMNENFVIMIQSIFPS